MYRIRYIHWNEKEALERVKKIAELGFVVDGSQPYPPQLLKDLTENPPDAIVIDLGRLPSQGRDLAVTIRTRKSCAHIPLIFLGGEPEKVQMTQAILPDATYCGWEGLREGVIDAIENSPENPVIPDSVFAGYSGTPLHKKLGLKKQMAVSLVNGPEDFPGIIGDLAEHIKWFNEFHPESDMVILFSREFGDLESSLSVILTELSTQKIWLAWPKQSSGVKSDLTQQQVREYGLSLGFVDYKICSIDKTWSGLLFTPKKS